MTFDQLLAHHRAAYRSGAHFAREALATKRAQMRGPVGCSPSAKASYWLGAAHACRDCVMMRTHSPAHKKALRASLEQRAYRRRKAA